jgi:hypothetical protein
MLEPRRRFVAAARRRVVQVIYRITRSVRSRNSIQFIGFESGCPPPLVLKLTLSRTRVPRSRVRFPLSPFNPPFRSLPVDIFAHHPAERPPCGKEHYHLWTEPNREADKPHCPSSSPGPATADFVRCTRKLPLRPLASPRSGVSGEVAARKSDNQAKPEKGQNGPSSVPEGAYTTHDGCPPEPVLRRPTLRWFARRCYWGRHLEV